MTRAFLSRRWLIVAVISLTVLPRALAQSPPVAAPLKGAPTGERVTPDLSTYPAATDQAATPILPSDATVEQEPQQPAEKPFLYPKASGRYRWISNDGDGGFGIQDFESASDSWRVWWHEAWPEDWKNFDFGLGFNVHWLEGPKPAGEVAGPDLPPRVYDFYLHGAWQPRLADWLLGDFVVNPGWFTDFNTKPPQSFRLRGHGAGIAMLSDEVSLVGGIDYINREKIKVLPIAGLLWTPDPDIQCQLVFPYPRIAARLWTHDETEWWGYVAGEYGGGAWEYRLSHGHDTLEYNDLRLTVGLEWVRSERGGGYFEVGYIFQRELNIRDARLELEPADTFMIGVGFTH